jgi:hypothetical protein
MTIITAARLKSNGFDETYVESALCEKHWEASFYVVLYSMNVMNAESAP